MNNPTFLTIKRYIHYRAVYFLLPTFLAMALCVSGQKTNRYGLHIVGSMEEYQQLPLQPGQRLVLIDSVLKPYFRHVAYQTDTNFTKKVLYIDGHQFFMVKEAAEKLAAVQDSLLKLGINLLLFDTYRPYSITEKMWAAVPDDRYAANPAKGSMHNRGLAIDLSLADAATGTPLHMPTGYDNFTRKAWPDYKNLPAEAIKNRNILQNIMKHFGFRSITTEWWHFYWPDRYGCPLLNLRFNQ